MLIRLLLSLLISFAVSVLIPLTTPLMAASDTPQPKKILLASTIGPIDAGIVGALEEAFTKTTGIVVEHTGTGTGHELKLAETGKYNLVAPGQAWIKPWNRQGAKVAKKTNQILKSRNPFVIYVLALFAASR